MMGHDLATTHSRGGIRSPATWLEQRSTILGFHGQTPLSQ
jgi:hypothetical protein